jgi:type IV secretion system protein VirD4
MKGDLYRNCGKIAKDCYGYYVARIDLRNPTRFDGNNLLQYMDISKSDPDNLVYKAKADK